MRREGQTYIPIEPTEPILPMSELSKKLGKDEKEIWTTVRVVEEKETGEKILLVHGIKTKEKDRTKRMVKKGGELNVENIVTGTRKRKNIDYKACSEKEGKRKSISNNTYEKRSKAVEKVSKKKRSTKKAKKVESDDEDKENIENQMIEEEEEQVEIIQAPKKARRNRKSISKPKEQAKEEVKEETPAWNLPLSPLVCNLLQKLGCVLPTENKKRSYKDEIIPEAANYFCGVTWPKDVTYVIDSSKTQGETVGLISHCLFVLSDEDGIKWVKENQDAVMLADGEGMLACRRSEAHDSDFPVYIILEAIENAEECVYKMKLSEYLASLTVDSREATQE